MHQRVVKVFRKRETGAFARASDFELLAVDVAGVLCLDLDLLGHLGMIMPGTDAPDCHEFVIIQLRTRQQVERFRLAPQFVLQ